MLRKLKYKVTFTNPKKTLQGDLEFKKGLTGITGRNGGGKSFVLEMIQFLLHGSEALRGKATDYEELEGDLIFEVNGRSLLVSRSKTKANLMEEKYIEGREAPFLENLASGTKAVNAKIEEIFGYSSDVFRVANVCNQGKIEELGDMKPTARKQLVDETIGLNVLDDVTTFIDGKRKDLTTSVKAIEGILVAPTEPERPLPIFEPSASYKQDRDRFALLRDDRNRLRVLAERPLVEPAKVELRADDNLFDTYVSQQQARAEKLTEFSVLNRELKAIPVYQGKIVTELEPDDAMQEQYLADLKALARLDTEIEVNQRGLDKLKWAEPLLSYEEIAAYKARNLLVDRWRQKMCLKQNNVPHDCPKCQHHWEDEDPRLKTEFADVPDEEPEAGMDPFELQNRERDITTHATSLPIVARLAELRAQASKYDGDKLDADIKRIGATRAAFHESQVARSNEQRRTELQAKVNLLAEQIANMPDRSAEIESIRKVRAAHQTYLTLLQGYQAQLKDSEDAKRELVGFPEDLDTQLALAESTYITVLNYENNLAAYQKAKEAYDKAMVQLQGLKDELVQWDNARKAVVDLRAKVKGYLLPSLNSVASLLIEQMTAGELSWITVNEDFEITVQGQRLETLSGAGKAVANLALRIGLGQVLTNRVFSVMMLDEIDASCDDDRAQFIAGCMMNLTKTIKQVIQVSHKNGLVADQHVRL